MPYSNGEEEVIPESANEQLQESRDDDTEEQLPNYNLLEIKVVELIDIKKMVDEYYSEGISHKAVEKDLAHLFVKTSDTQKKHFKEGEA